MLQSICQLTWKTQQWSQDWKRSGFIPNPKKGNAKECSNYCTIAIISHTSKVMLTVLQAKLQQYMNHELPDVQAGFRKGRGTRDQIANICWIIEKARVPEKHLFFALLTMPKALTVWITIISVQFISVNQSCLTLCDPINLDHNKLENSERDGNTRPPDLPLEKPICRSGSSS